MRKSMALPMRMELLRARDTPRTLHFLREGLGRLFLLLSHRINTLENLGVIHFDVLCTSNFLKDEVCFQDCCGLGLELRQ